MINSQVNCLGKGWFVFYWQPHIIVDVSQAGPQLEIISVFWPIFSVLQAKNVQNCSSQISGECGIIWMYSQCLQLLGLFHLIWLILNWESGLGTHSLTFRSGLMKGYEFINCGQCEHIYMDQTLCLSLISPCSHSQYEIL